MKELPLPYVPIDPRIEDSQRFADFVEAGDLYDDPFALFYIVKLLLYAGKNAVDGNVGRMPARKLARDCAWQKDPEEFRRLLLVSGWLHENDKGELLIEGWERHGGRVLQDRIRKRNDRKGGGKKAVSREPEVIPGPVRDTSRTPPGTGAEVPGRGTYEQEQEREQEQENIVVVIDHARTKILAATTGRPMTTRDIDESIMNWGWKPMPRKWVPLLDSLAPFPAAYVEAAKRETEADCRADGSKPNAGLFVRKLEAICRTPAALPMQSRPRDGPVRGIAKQEVALRRALEFAAESNMEAFTGVLDAGRRKA